MELKNSMIAVATDDGNTVSSHFGQARYYEVLKLSGGKVAGRERREKAVHHSFGQTEGEHEHRHDDHESHERRHRAMTSPITDCQAVVVRGMGQGAVEHLRQASLVPILTGLHTIEEVIGAISSGSLESDPRRIHEHHGN